MSPVGGLYFTLVLSPSAPATFAGFALGVAAAEVLGAHGVSAGLKWPNDLLFASDGRTWGKVAGILGETRDGRVLVGIGINLRTAPASLASAAPAPFPPATFHGSSVAKASPESLVHAIATGASRHWDGIVANGPAPLLRAWESFCVHRDRTVKFLDQNGSEFEGRFVGLADDGAACVSAPGVRRTFYAGELRCFW